MELALVNYENLLEIIFRWEKWLSYRLRRLCTHWFPLYDYILTVVDVLSKEVWTAYPLPVGGHWVMPPLKSALPLSSPTPHLVAAPPAHLTASPPPPEDINQNCQRNWGEATLTSCCHHCKLSSSLPGQPLAWKDEHGRDKGGSRQQWWLFCSLH